MFGKDKLLGISSAGTDRFQKLLQMKVSQTQVNVFYLIENGKIFIHAILSTRYRH